MTGTTARWPGALQHRTGPSFWLAVPALAFFACFALVPLGGVVVLSFMEWDGLGTPQWAAAGIWADTVTDPDTRAALGRTVVFVVGSYLFQAPIALLLGVFMAGRQRYRALWSVLYFLPLLFSSAAIGITFRSLLDPNFGLSRAFGDGSWFSTNWLGDPDRALYAVIFVVGWCFIPFHALLYQAGVRQIPASLYEAAMLDGAGRVKQFQYVTLPLLRYTIVTSSTLLVGSLTYFDLVFVLTGGGPGDATRILPLDMYLTGFRSNEMGPASVIAVLLVAVGLALSLFLSRISGSSSMQSQQSGT